MIFTATLKGIGARVVQVTAERRPGLAGLRIRGLATAAERESRVRVMASLANIDRFIDEVVTVTCEAGGAVIDACGADLAIALAAAVRETTKTIAAIGELSLSGEVRPVRGVLPMVEALRGSVDTVLVAVENGPEAALVSGIRVFVVRHLADALRFIVGEEGSATRASSVAVTRARAHLDIRDVAGQPRARRALEIAAAGGHHLLLIGGPGSGKTMLARRVASLLPPLTRNEALEVTRVYSAAGLNVGGGLVTERPFRAPHHSTTPPGLVGGVAGARPGEISLAHHGVLFLDELPEFSRASLEVLREPLQTGDVVLARASGTLRFPARPMLVASMAPCPCGRFGSVRCSCSVDARRRYLARIPDALLAAIDVRVTVTPTDLSHVDSEAPRESSATVAARVAHAQERLGAAEMAFEADVSKPFSESRTARDRTQRVARTIAALDGDSCVSARHVEEALTFVCDP